MNDEADYFDELLVGAEEWAIDQIREESQEKDKRIYELEYELNQYKTLQNNTKGKN